MSTVHQTSGSLSIGDGRCGTGRRRALCIAGPVAVLCALAQPAPADLPLVEILAAGQHVERLGALGGFGLTLCLGDDGRVGAGVSGGDGRRALTCGDATGFTAVVREGEPSPRGGPFLDFTDCALPADGALYFSATRRAPPDGEVVEDVYRSTAEGIEWIVGADTIALDGTLLRYLLALNGGNVRGWPVSRSIAAARCWCVPR